MRPNGSIGCKDKGQLLCFESSMGFLLLDNFVLKQAKNGSCHPSVDYCTVSTTNSIETDTAFIQNSSQRVHFIQYQIHI